MGATHDHTIRRSGGPRRCISVCRALLRAFCGQSTIAILQSLDSWFHASSHLATTPLIACVPKWVLARDPVTKLNVKFENSTNAWAPAMLGFCVPPRTQMVTGDGLPNGGLPPFPVT